MPGLVMHHHFASVVHKSLSDEIKKSINNRALYDFASYGPDSHKFHDFLSKDKIAESLAYSEYMHTHNTKNFLVELLKLAKLNHDLFPYIAGYVCHYYLDSTSNPYIYYKSGLYDKNVNNSIKYRGLKLKLERAMDAYVIENYNYGPSTNKYRIKRKLLNLRKLPKSIMHDIDVLYMKTYDINNGYKFVNKTIRNQRLVYALIYDPLGIKNKLFEKIDNGKSYVCLKYMSFYNKSLNARKLDLFNFKHERWFNPVKEEIYSIDSFFDLFEKAKKMSLKCIEAMYKYVFLDEEMQFDFFFQNISYYTSLDCEANNEMKNFNIIFK